MLLCGCTPQQKQAAPTPTESIADMEGDMREQAIVDRLYLIQHCDSAARRAAWSRLHAELDDCVDRTVTDYLGEPDSPLYSPALLEEYLESLARRLPADDLSRARAEYLLDGIRKNRLGSIIADIALVTASGNTTSLHTLINQSGEKECLVMFYDPTCEACDEAIGRMSADTTRRVIAVSVTDAVKTLPEGWKSTRVADSDALDSLFYHPSLPQIYAVSQDGRTIARY